MGEIKKVGAFVMKEILFPACGSACAAMEYLGVGECESVCPWKFEKDGTSKTVLSEADMIKAKEIEAELK